MADGADRPVPRSRAIDPDERMEILRELLDIERDRLKNALRLEQDRSIVFPETTVIVKDIERIISAMSNYGDEETEATVAPRQVEYPVRRGGPLYPRKRER